MKAVLLNIDAGELPDEPEELYRYAHVVHLACGGHAGGTESIERGISLAKQYGTRIGAHPSYPDRERFGRVELSMTEDQLRQTLHAQCGLLMDIALRMGVSVVSFKPHGALYHRVAHDRAMASVVVSAAIEAMGSGFVVVGPADSALFHAARERGLLFQREQFADRAVRADGTLVPRGEPGAVLTDAAAVLLRLEELLRQGRADTVCLHGDTAGSAELARAVRSRLEQENQ